MYEVCKNNHVKLIVLDTARLDQEGVETRSSVSGRCYKLFRHQAPPTLQRLCPRWLSAS